MRRTSFLIMLVIFFVGCSSKTKPINDLEKVFTDLKEDEYWGVYYNYYSYEFYGHYTKFMTDGTYKNYKWDIYDEKHEKDTTEIKKWKVTKDSIFYYDYRFQYKVVLANEGAILVSSGDKKIDLIFIKESEKHLRKLDWELDSESLNLENPIPYEKWLEIMKD